MDKPWKKYERECAALIDGKRFWSNSGEACDIEGDRFVGQCKLVKVMSLAELTKLAVVAAAQGAARAKHGIVCAKVREGRGFPTPTLVVMTADVFQALCARIPS